MGPVGFFTTDKNCLPRGISGCELILDAVVLNSGRTGWKRPM